MTPTPDAESLRRLFDAAAKKLRAARDFITDNFTVYCDQCGDPVGLADVEHFDASRPEEIVCAKCHDDTGCGRCSICNEEKAGECRSEFTLSGMVLQSVEAQRYF